MIKLNIGCGLDYRCDFINIDGRGDLPRIDRIMNLSEESLPAHFEVETVDFILANDFIEHHFHWQAVRLLQDFFFLLKRGGTLEMRLPDFQKIIKSFRISADQKITLLFGGQDVPQGEPDPSSRESYPEYFCHKYAYTRASMQRELKAIGFVAIETKTAGTNFIVKARKP